MISDPLSLIVLSDAHLSAARKLELVFRIQQPYQTAQLICSNCGLSQINLMSRLFADDRVT